MHEFKWRHFEGQIADLRDGFIEADVVAVDDPDRSW
jgi:hypothetical protein